MIRPGSDPLIAAAVRLRAAAWDGCQLPVGEVERLLDELGFADVRVLPGPAHATVAMVAGRRKGG